MDAELLKCIVRLIRDSDFRIMKQLEAENESLRLEISGLKEIIYGKSPDKPGQRDGES